MKRPLQTLLFVGCILACVPLLPAATPVKKIPKTKISSEELKMQNKGNTSYFVFTDNVKLTGNNLTVTCDKLEVFADRVGDLKATIGKIGAIQKIVATGNVTISQAGRKALAGRAEVLPREDKIILTEHPVLQQIGQAVMEGQKITVYRGEGRAVVDKPNATLNALPDLGFSAGADQSAGNKTGDSKPDTNTSTGK